MTAIVGGTGTLGRRVAAELEARGNQVRPLSRHAPEYRVVLATGDGLGPALAGCDVVVDAGGRCGPAPSPHPSRMCSGRQASRTG